MTRPPTARRVVDWTALKEGALTLPKAERAVVGGTWRERMRQEHLAVGAFSLLTQELAEQGCDAAVLSLVARAVADEVRHTKVCGQSAVAMLGPSAVPKAWRGLPTVPPHDGLDARTRVLLHMVEMCCLSETLTGVFFTEMIARASNTAARTVVESLLEEEIDHGRVGWAYLATRRESLGGLAEALPSMLDRTFGTRAASARPKARERRDGGLRVRARWRLRADLQAHLAGRGRPRLRADRRRLDAVAHNLGHPARLVTTMDQMVHVRVLGRVALVGCGGQVVGRVSGAR